MVDRRWPYTTWRPSSPQDLTNLHLTSRHTTQPIERLRTFQRILRHSYITATTGTYVEVVKAVQRDALDSMGSLFGVGVQRKRLALMSDSRCRVKAVVDDLIER